MVSEFEFINNIKSKYRLDKVGDDCAVLPKDAETDLLMTADLLIEDIDFRLEWTTPEFLGHKALAVSLSDIAAMGGRPVWSMLSIGVPKDLWGGDFVERFYAGWHRLARRSGVELVGGDISRTPDKLVIDSIIGGDVSSGMAILRSGATVGEAIVVTDHIGGSAGGLKLLEAGRAHGPELESWEDVLMRIHLQPWPQIGTGIYLQQHGLATSMIDISDGLSSDLQHLCQASRVGAKLYSEKIPLNLNLDRICDNYDEQLNLGLNGGEDFQLLFTIPQNKIPDLSANMIGGQDHGLFSVVGEATENIGVIEFIHSGETEILESKGYRHF